MVSHKYKTSENPPLLISYSIELKFCHNTSYGVNVQLTLYFFLTAVLTELMSSLFFVLAGPRLETLPGRRLLHSKALGQQRSVPGSWIR